jgi:predicted NACHT family NTPase
MRQFSGLLVERGHNAFGFRHLTFQEYFAGRALARMTAELRWELIGQNLHSNRWREPILLAAARLGVTENRGAQATGLIKRILNAGSDHESRLHRDLFLAADCAIDDINVALPELRRIAVQIEALLSACVPSLAVGALHRLYQLSQLQASDQPRLPEARTALITALQLDKVIKMPRIVREVANDVLHNLLSEQPDLRAVISDHLADNNWDMRQAAITALAPLLPHYPDLCAAVRDCLADIMMYVRRL